MSGEAAHPGYRDDLVWLPILKGYSGRFDIGYEKFRAAISQDPTLPEQIRLLIICAVAAVKKDLAILHSSVERAKAIGIDRRSLLGVAMTCFISRGMLASELLLDTVAQVYPLPDDVSEHAPDADDVHEAATAHFKGVYGTLPGFIAVLNDHSQAAVDSWYLMTMARREEGHLDAKTVELILCAINVAEHQPEFIATHARGARAAGASEDELVAAAMITLPYVGLASWLSAAKGFANE